MVVRPGQMRIQDGASRLSERVASVLVVARCVPTAEATVGFVAALWLRDTIEHQNVENHLVPPKQVAADSTLRSFELLSVRLLGLHAELHNGFRSQMKVGVSALTALSAFAVFGPADGSAEGTPEGSDR